MLNKDGSFTVHYYNTQTLALELHKVYNNISQTTFWELFTRNNNNYYLRSKCDFVIPQINPTRTKNITSLNIFKKEIRRWKPKNRPGRICRNYVHNLGFVELFE